MIFSNLNVFARTGLPSWETLPIFRDNGGQQNTLKIATQAKQPKSASKSQSTKIQNIGNFNCALPWDRVWQRESYPDRLLPLFPWRGTHPIARTRELGPWG